MVKFHQHTLRSKQGHSGGENATVEDTDMGIVPSANLTEANHYTFYILLSSWQEGCKNRHVYH